MSSVVYLPSSLKGDAQYFVSEKAYELYLSEEAKLKKNLLNIGFNWKLFLTILIKELT